MGLCLSIIVQGPYEPFILFGDSLTQFSSDQERGFASQPALQHGRSSVSMRGHVKPSNIAIPFKRQADIETLLLGPQ